MCKNDQSFSKQQKLICSSEFDAVFKKPFRSASGSFTILASRNQQENPRLGLIISKRCAKHAVQRNRLKRLIRESFRMHKSLLAGLDIVVIGKTKAVTKQNRDLLGLLDRQWKELEQCKPC